MIAANVCRDYYRREQEIPVGELPDRPNPCMELLDEQIAVRTALARLPAEIKEIAVLYFTQGCKQRDIARIQGISLPLEMWEVSSSWN